MNLRCGIKVCGGGSHPKGREMVSIGLLLEGKQVVRKIIGG